MPTYSDNCGNSYELPEHVWGYKVEVDEAKGITLTYPSLNEAIFLINPEEESWSDNLYRFTFGAYGDIRCFVYGKGEGSALETAADWLSEHYPGQFVALELDVARAELAEKDKVEPSSFTEAEVFDFATVDLTYTESGWLASWEWTLDDATDEEIEVCKELSDIINEID